MNHSRCSHECRSPKYPFPGLGQQVAQIEWHPNHHPTSLSTLLCWQGRQMWGKSFKTPGCSCVLNPQAIIQTHKSNCSRLLLNKYNRLVTPQYQVVGSNTLTIERGWPWPPDRDNSWCDEWVVWMLSPWCLSVTISPGSPYWQWVKLWDALIIYVYIFLGGEISLTGY